MCLCQQEVCDREFGSVFFFANFKYSCLAFRL